MVVGSLRVTLRLHGVTSLKEKRSPRRMLTDRVRSRFKVAASEVGDQDVLNLITLGFATVGPDATRVESVLRRVADFIEDSGVGELIDETIFLDRKS
jgi:uncharacterized protein YlxP (DUF503 family)